MYSLLQEQCRDQGLLAKIVTSSRLHRACNSAANHEVFHGSDGLLFNIMQVVHIDKAWDSA
jgi:hypothetical protein